MYSFFPRFYGLFVRYMGNLALHQAENRTPVNCVTRRYEVVLFPREPRNAPSDARKLSIAASWPGYTGWEDVIPGYLGTQSVPAGYVKMHTLDLTYSYSFYHRLDRRERVGP